MKIDIEDAELAKSVLNFIHCQNAFKDLKKIRPARDISELSLRQIIDLVATANAFLLAMETHRRLDTSSVRPKTL